jgi:hypothetical protein
MKEEQNIENDPFQDVFFAAGYIELVMENIHRGLIDINNIETTATTIRHITDTHPIFWLITYTGGRRASVPISVQNSIITNDEATESISFWALRLDKTEWIEISRSDDPVEIRVLPVSSTDKQLDYSGDQ